MSTHDQDDDLEEPDLASSEVGSSTPEGEPQGSSDVPYEPLHESGFADSSEVPVDNKELESGGKVVSPELESEETQAPLASSEVQSGDSSPAPEKNGQKRKKKKKRTGDKRGSRTGMGLTPLGFGLRFVAALALVFGTYNPSGTSYYHWVASLESTDLPAKILLGLLVLAGWVVFFRATSRSLGPVGAILAAAVCGVALWWLIDLNVVAQSTDAITYAVLFIISVILTLGLTGSFVWRRLTGQYQVDADDGSMDD